MPASDDRESDLARHRAAIDALDREILERLNARATHAQAIGALKGGGRGVPPRARGTGALAAAVRQPGAAARTRPSPASFAR